ncbi:MAG: ABC transporter permease [Chlamydiae bacterium]|nr:ABC transporter permease [Chlamydiota bacterium]
MIILRLFLKRLLQFSITLFCIVTVTFFLMKALPGDPFTEEQAIPQEILNQLYQYYGLDQPLYKQYLKYLKGIACLDLGPSLKYEGRYVNDVIKESFPISLSLGLLSLCFSTSFGLVLGTFSAHYKNSWQDRVLTGLIILGISIPSFVMATFLQYFFALKWNFLPIARWGTISHMILPALSLGGLPMAYIARLCKTQVLEVMSQDYIIFAKSKGLTPFQIIQKHVLKNAILPIITYIGHMSASILTGSFVIEKIFGIPGLGFWFVSSIANRDYTMIMGLTIFFSFVVTLMIFLVDMIYIILDPKIATRVKQDYESKRL